jgi:hypothetical protein
MTRIRREDLTANERAVLDRIAATMASRDEILEIVTIERKSEREYDVRFDATVDAPSLANPAQRFSYSMGGWLPLGFIRECTVWTSRRIASLTDYPEMAAEGDWSGVRDSSTEAIWNIFLASLGGAR